MEEYCVGLAVMATSCSLRRWRGVPRWLYNSRHTEATGSIQPTRNGDNPMPKMGLHGDYTAISGKQMDQVCATTKSAVIRRQRVIPANPRTTPQVNVRQNFTQATVTYSLLAPEVTAQWEVYASTLRVTDPVSGKVSAPAPGTVFTGLAAKFLQVNPGAVIPQTPPTSTFTGDAVTMSVAGAAGHVTFTASQANGENIITELMVQKLPGTNRKPGKDKFRTEAFITFQGSSLSQNVTLPAGRYACASRFVAILTGQMSPETVLGTVDVT